MTDAVDALTLGSVNFLPKRITEISTIFEPASESERQEILPRLQQILTARISSVELPIQFTNVIISKSIFPKEESDKDISLLDRKWNSNIDCRRRIRSEIRNYQ